MKQYCNICGVETYENNNKVKYCTLHKFAYDKLKTEAVIDRHLENRLFLLNLMKRFYVSFLLKQSEFIDNPIEYAKLMREIFITEYNILPEQLIDC